MVEKWLEYDWEKFYGFDNITSEGKFKCHFSQIWRKIYFIGA